MKPKVWSKKTSFSSCFILGALELHFVPFPFYVYMRLDSCYCVRPAWSFPMFYLSLAAIWEPFLYQIL